MFVLAMFLDLSFVIRGHITKAAFELTINLMTRKAIRKRNKSLVLCVNWPLGGALILKFVLWMNPGVKKRLKTLEFSGA